MQTGIQQITIPEAQAEQHPLNPLIAILESQLASMKQEFNIGADNYIFPADAFKKQRGFKRQTNSLEDDNNITRLLEVLHIDQGVQAPAIKSSFSWVLKGMGSLLGNTNTDAIYWLLRSMDTFLAEQDVSLENKEAVTRLSVVLRKILGMGPVDEFVAFDQLES